MTQAAPDPMAPTTPQLRTGFLALLAALLAGAVIGGGLVYWYWQVQGAGASEREARLAQAASQQLQATADLQARLEAEQSLLRVEQSTSRGLRQALTTAQEELGQARERLAFFDSLLPPGPLGSVSVRALDIQPRGPYLAYKVVLMRNASGGPAFDGSLEFVAHGLRQGKPAEVRLAPATSQPSGSPPAKGAGSAVLALQFEQFQRSEGLLALPAGFQPRSVTVNVLEGPRHTVRATSTVNLPAAD